MQRDRQIVKFLERVRSWIRGKAPRNWERNCQNKNEEKAADRRTKKKRQRTGGSEAGRGSMLVFFKSVARGIWTVDSDFVFSMYLRSMDLCGGERLCCSFT